MSAKQVATKPKGFLSRIVGHAEIPAQEIKAHPMNARLHPEPQKAALNRILTKIGWVGSVIVNKRTGLLLDGHARVDLAAEKNQKVPVTYVDLSVEEEKLVLAALDPITSMAVTDDRKLQELLADIEMPSDDELSVLLSSLLEDSIEEAPQQRKLAPAPKKAPRNLGNRRTQIKPVLYAENVQVLENAIRLAGELNRGKAIIKICQFYIEANTE